MSIDHNSIRPWRSISRRKSRKIWVGDVPVGGDAPITVQSMTNTLTSGAAGEMVIRQVLKPGDKYIVPEEDGLVLSTGNADFYLFCHESSFNTK